MGWVYLRKTREPVVQMEDIKQLRAEITELRTAFNELREDMKRLQEVNAETEKTNVLLYPQNFDKDKNDGKTVFVKDGEEKPYETIDWRSR
jgi:prefoldin subunit 5